MNINAMMIDGPANGMVVSIPSDMSIWEVAMVDPHRHSLKFQRDVAPYAPTFRTARYTRMPIATPTSINTTPSGFTLFVWDGRER